MKPSGCTSQTYIMLFANYISKKGEKKTNTCRKQGSIEMLSTAIQKRAGKRQG